ncbi:Hypp9442 [Branchiostoma lanceolatum]|uniref:Hypp9442 protein n=1 Tax=Branchiostoma lanceolatum TaxID=7740 RepID=A0A8S4MM22_BRALA|nr:Hypp9442 [Branchiostoma lanceolatum]
MSVAGMTGILSRLVPYPCQLLSDNRTTMTNNSHPPCWSTRMSHMYFVVNVIGNKMAAGSDVAEETINGRASPAVWRAQSGLLSRRRIQEHLATQNTCVFCGQPASCRHPTPPTENDPSFPYVYSYSETIPVRACQQPQRASKEEGRTYPASSLVELGISEETKFHLLVPIQNGDGCADKIGKTRVHRDPRALPRGVHAWRGKYKLGRLAVYRRDSACGGVLKA